MEEVRVISDAELRTVIRAATRAPSSHNTQPWFFSFEDGIVSIYADRLRSLPANDPFDRELTLSCGSALFNLRARLAALGFEAQPELLPEGPRSDLMARLRLEAVASEEAENEARLAASIEERRTTRGGFTSAAPDADLVERMQGAAALEGAWLEVISGRPQREALSELIATGDQRQFADPTWRRELASWMHPRRSGDGLAVAGFSRPIAKLVVSAFDLGKTTGRRDARLADDAPYLLVLGTDLDLDEDWLKAGQALQRSLLIAASEGVQAGYLNQPCQVSDLRPRLRDLLANEGHAQVVMRIGYPDSQVDPSPRRDVDQVLQKTFRVTSRFS